MENQNTQNMKEEVQGANPVSMLLFGVDTETKVDTVLQNNLTLFAWAVKNKRYPDFVGRYISGENPLTQEEKDFIHRKGCMIAAIYRLEGDKKTEEDGANAAKAALEQAEKLEMAQGRAIFFEIDEAKVSRDFLLGIAKTVSEAGYVPGFKANTDSKYTFDGEFSRGMSTHKEEFEKCLVWAVAPTLKEYNKITTTHMISPDVWTPFAPSCMKRSQIAVWQYGKDCHPIYDDKDHETKFNINLVRDTDVIVYRMF